MTIEQVLKKTAAELRVAGVSERKVISNLIKNIIKPKKA
jgi:hypothetical protein